MLVNKFLNCASSYIWVVFNKCFLPIPFYGVSSSVVSAQIYQI